ncbi:hypothetical protein [Acinetobacter lactucae]|uniref:hypothetical protein n=1 Tax=Acinetobacter lactucae TaxID=1785128 RepID=UPI001580F545|nr:hypothetical protein [Acinetobacter lactucae]NUG49685.1 hypothetical protein [Acinetobacter lactucae]
MTLSEIRNNLMKLAELKRRPPYDLCVAKAVRDAFADGTHNDLKEELISLLRIQLQEKKDESEVFLSQAQKRMPAKRDDVKAMIKWVSQEVGRAERLAEAAELDSSLISAMRKNGRCTIDLYSRLVKGKAKMMLGELEA